MSVGLDATAWPDGAVGWPRGVPRFDEPLLGETVPVLDLLCRLGRDVAHELAAVFDCERSVDLGRLDVKVRRRMLVWIDLNSQAIDALDKLLVLEQEQLAIALEK